jgi:HSP20 family protein
MQQKSDEQFFEELSHVSGTEESAEENLVPAEDAGEDLHVELAKASTSTLHRPRVATRQSRGKMLEDAEVESEGQLTIDVYQTATDIVIESAVAGVRPEDLDIDVTTDSVSIKGTRRREKEVRDEDYFYRECYWGRFSRSIILPEEIDAEDATVSFKNGILKVHLPKLNRQKARKLKVKFE